MPSLFLVGLFQCILEFRRVDLIFAVIFPDDIGDLPLNLLDFGQKTSRRYPYSAVPEDDDLFQIIRGSHTDVVLFRDLVGDLFDIHIGSFSLFGVDDGNIAVLFH